MKKVLAAICIAIALRQRADALSAGKSQSRKRFDDGLRG